MEISFFNVLLFVFLLGSMSTFNGMKRTLDDLYAFEPESLDLVHKTNSSFSPATRKKTCYVCFKIKTADEFFILACAHSKICNSCMSDAINIALHEKSSLTLRCIDWDCKKPFEWQELQQLLQSDELLVFNEIMLSEYLANNKDIQYCPHLHCGYAFIASNQRCAVTCDKCNKSFCSRCRIDHYWITPCAIAQYLK